MSTDLFDVSGEDVVVRLVAHPGAGRTAVVGRHGDALKVKVSAPPVEGRANRAVEDLLAEVLGVERARVTVVAGESSRTKRVRIEGLGADDARKRLDEAMAGAAAPAGGGQGRGDAAKRGGRGFKPR